MELLAKGSLVRNKIILQAGDVLAGITALVPVLSRAIVIALTERRGNQTCFGIHFDTLDRFSKTVLTTLVPSLKI